MLISDRRLGESIVEALERLAQRADIPADARYDLTVAATGMRHTQHFETGGRQQMQHSASALLALLDDMAATGDAPTQDILAGLRQQAQAFITASSGVQHKDEFIALLNTQEQTLGRLVREVPEAGAQLARTVEALIGQQTGIAMLAPSGEPAMQEVSSGNALTRENLSAYLREQLGDPTISVDDVVTLPGGFGKETTLFAAQGRTFTGKLVMRRDTPINVFGNLECHLVKNEFPLVRAMYQRGVPVPEPLWCEPAPSIIKGPGYSIVRRVPGEVQGDATGGSSKISSELQEKLAQVLASLHALPPLDELCHTPAFDPAFYAMTSSERTRSYIAGWYDHYLDSARAPTPALHGLFNWLLANVPESDAKTTLIHGDFGFHNLLFDDGRLSAVLDWEFSHVGDPAEDIAYVRNMMGGQMDWSRFIAAYREAGGSVPDERRILYFEIWSHVRNAAATVLMGAPFEAGRLRNVKYGMMFHRFIPHFIAQAGRLVARWDT